MPPQTQPTPAAPVEPPEDRLRRIAAKLTELCSPRPPRVVRFHIEKES